MFRRLKNCHNVEDLRLLAKQRLPGPIFDYIDGAADDEVSYRRNTSAFEDCDLVPNVLAGVAEVDMSVTVMGQKLDMPIFCSPTALQRLFHHDGERAVAQLHQPREAILQRDGSAIALARRAPELRYQCRSGTVAGVNVDPRLGVSMCHQPASLW